MRRVAMGVAILATSMMLVVAAQAQSVRSFLYSGAFLEPAQFSIIKSVQDRTLRLQMGYGGDLVGSTDWRIGTEGLIWSRLRALPDFRFPVETADYFFGFYG